MMNVSVLQLIIASKFVQTLQDPSSVTVDQAMFSIQMEPLAQVYNPM